MAPTIFTKIIRGEIPCHKIYEDSRVLAFLDIFPLSRGHTLVIPKHPAVTMADLPDEDAAGLGLALPRICRALLQATQAPAFNILQNNGQLAHQAVLHVHFHVIPRYDDGTGLGITWQPGKLDANTGAALAASIAAKLA